MKFELGVIFRRKLKQAIRELGWSIDPSGRLVDENGNVIKCMNCGKELCVEDIGGLLLEDQQIRVLCKSPRCLHMLPWYYHRSKKGDEKAW